MPNIFVGKDQTFRKRDALTFRNVMGLQITLYRVRGPFELELELELLHMHASLGVEFQTV